jgi:hypothetical protein
MSKAGKRAALAGLLAFALGPALFADRAGNHTGEQKQLDVDIAFSDEYGYTLTNPDGTYYCYWGTTVYEDKVYPEAYHGIYPLYFFNTRVGVTVTVTNNGPRRKAKLRIRTEACVLRTDGSNGAPLTVPREIDIEVARGETRVIDASFIAQPSADTESGLDRFLVKVSHPNAGEGSDGNTPALILMKEGIFCPPEYAGD